MAVNGVCLTVAALDGATARFDVIAQTLGCTSLGSLLCGQRVNLERALRLGDRLDGHLVQGHVETTGQVLQVVQGHGERRIRVGCEPSLLARILPKGSITVDGVSLTVAELHPDGFTVALVPHTLERTNLADRRAGDIVNLEPDVIGQWVLRLLDGSGALPGR